MTRPALAGWNNPCGFKSHPRHYEALAKYALGTRKKPPHFKLKSPPSQNCSNLDSSVLF